MDYTHQGKRKTLSLGTYPKTSIKLAREKAMQARALLAAGTDPSEQRKQTKAMSNNTLLAALKRMGYAGRMTGHGFRGLASTVLHEQGYPHHIIKLQLAHQERNQVSAAYNFATHIEERRAMMNDWADYLDKTRRGADIIPMPSRVA